MSEIHVLTITHGPMATQESFFYTAAATAAAQWEAFESSGVGEFTFRDDFGNVGVIAGAVHSVRQSNMEKSLALQGEQSLIQAREQAKLQRRAASDPTLNLTGGAPLGAVTPFPKR